MPSNKKYFIFYCRISVKEGLNSDLKTSELILGKYDKEVYQKCQYCHQVIKIKKGFKKMPLFATCVLNFYKIWIKLIHKSMLYGQKTKNIGFLQTSIVLMWIVYSDMKISKISMVKFHRKLLIFI